MQIIKFLIANWDSVLVIIVAGCAVVVLIKKGETRILQNALYRLVTEAERQFGTGTGELKFIAVSDWIYERLPLIIRYLFTKNDIKKMIESALDAAKKKWEQNINLQAYVSGDSTQLQ